MTAEIRFFALRSNKEKVLDRGQDGFNVAAVVERKIRTHPDLLSISR